MSKLFAAASWMRVSLLLAAFSAGASFGQADDPRTAPAHQASPNSRFDPEAATRSYLARLPPDQKARSDAYFEGGYWLTLWSFLYTAAVLVFLLVTGWSARLRNWAERQVRFKPIQTILYWTGYSVVTTVSGFPLAILVGLIFTFVTSPLLRSFIRVQEYEADVFGLNAARQPDGFAEVTLKLSEYRKLDPGPIEEWIFYDHPSGRVRIYTAMRWKAENMPQ